MNEPAEAPAPRRRGPARSFTREQVVEAAVAVMAEQGLDTVSFRTVAMRLGVDPKALYTYVSDKDDLRAAMFDHILAGLDVPSADDPRPVVERVVALLVSVRRTLIRNPDMFRLSRPLDVPGFNADAWERMAETIQVLDADLEVALRVFGRLINYTLGSALFAQQVPLHLKQAEGGAVTLDPERHPKAFDLARKSPFLEDEEAFADAIRVMLAQRIGEP